MYALKIVRALAPIDARSVRRDSMLAWLILLPLAMALMARTLFPVVIRQLGEAIGIDLIPYYPDIMGASLLLLTPVLCGMVVGYLLLDQRDDRSLTALQVTPMSSGAYLTYRLATPMLVSWLVTAISLPVAGLAEGGLPQVLASSLAAAPLAPLVAIALPSFAENKVQGFALIKASSIFTMAPLIAYFVPAPWQPAFGVVPTYWPAMIYWTAGAGESAPGIILYLLAGLAYQSLLLAALLRRFDRVIHQ